MTACVGCSGLIGKLAVVKPHSMMSGERVKVRSDGLLEQFRCRSCGTYWERFESNRNYCGEPQFWRFALRA
jgi:hypothetical protein